MINIFKVPNLVSAIDSSLRYNEKEIALVFIE